MDFTDPFSSITTLTALDATSIRKEREQLMDHMESVDKYQKLERAFTELKNHNRILTNMIKLHYPELLL